MAAAGRGCRAILGCGASVGVEAENGVDLGSILARGRFSDRNLGMNVTLDGTPLVGADSIGGALRAGIQAARQKHRLVVEVNIDGERVKEGDIEALMSGVSALERTAREIALVSAEPRSLASMTLLDAATRLEASREEHEQAARALQIGETNVALAQLTVVFNAWQTARDALHTSSALLGLPLERLSCTTADGRAHTAGECVSRLTRDLLSAQNAARTGDWSALADTVAYDLSELLSVWTSLLRATAAGIAGTFGGRGSAGGSGGGQGSAGGSLGGVVAAPANAARSGGAATGGGVVGP